MDGTGGGGREVIVGRAFVFTTPGVSVTSVATQDTRVKQRRRLKIGFIKCILSL